MDDDFLYIHAHVASLLMNNMRRDDSDRCPYNTIQSCCLYCGRTWKAICPLPGLAVRPTSQPASRPVSLCSLTSKVVMADEVKFLSFPHISPLLWGGGIVSTVQDICCTVGKEEKREREGGGEVHSKHDYYYYYYSQLPKSGRWSVRRRSVGLTWKSK